MDYYRKNIDNTANDIKLKMQIGGLTVKMTENINKINDLLEVDKDIKKNVVNNSNSIKNMKNEIDLELSDKIDNYYDKNEIDLKFGDLYNKTYIDHKLNDIYDKNQTNDKISKLDRNIVLFNTNLTNFIDKTYKNDKKLIEDDITENKTKLDKLSYYIKEFFMHNTDLVRRFNITSEMDYIQILQFEIDRNFLVNDVIKFFISIKLLYENMSKIYWVLCFKMDVHYKDDILIKSFNKQMTSKGFLFKNLATFNIDNMFKLNKDTDRLIFKLYMYKVSTAYKNDVTVTLTNSLEENYCNLIWFSNQ